MHAYLSFAQNVIDGLAPDALALEDYSFATPALLGGKGFGLYEMCRDGLPVPPGFVITTDVFKLWQAKGAKVLVAIAEDLKDYLEALEEHFGYMPLLSVRSGAPVSMPGMMDTILNVGLNDETQPFWAKKIGLDASWDCRRRLHQMYAEIVLHIPKSAIEQIAKKCMIAAKADDLSQLNAMQKYGFVSRLNHYLAAKNLEVPETLEAQVLGAIEAVFRSWDNPRAVEYRKLHNIPADIGTAVVVQAMVFGNAGETSGTGVLFTRNPSTGERVITGEFLLNAQGEDVVAGTHTPLPFSGQVDGGICVASTGLDHVPESVAKAMLELMECAYALDAARKDMQDIEFTIQDGKLWLLQTRTGKRGPQAAFKIAMDQVLAENWTLEEAASKLTPEQFSLASRPTIDNTATCAKLGKPVITGLAASSGVAVGRAAFTVEAALQLAATDPVVLVRHETTPDDIAAMAASVAILTASGGFTSHAAVVARGMNKVCITGCEDQLELGMDPSYGPSHGQPNIALLQGADAGKDSILPGDWLTLNGATGEVWLGQGVLTGGADGAAMAFLKQLAAVKGIKLRSTEPMPGALVVAADYLLDGREEELIEALFQPLDGAVVDLRGPAAHLSEIDREFMRMTGAGLGSKGEISPRLERMAQALAAYKQQPLFVIFPPFMQKDVRERFAAQGSTVKLVPICETLEDVVSTDGVAILSEKLWGFAGGAAGRQVLQGLIEQYGVEALGDYTPLGEAAQKLLGQGK